MDKVKKILVTKLSIAEFLKTEFGGTRLQYELILDSVFEKITNVVANGNEVSIGKFGIFRLKMMQERNARNPKTGEKLTLKAENKIKFRPAIYFKEKIK